MKETVKLAMAAPAALTSALIESIDFNTPFDDVYKETTVSIRHAVITKTEDMIEATAKAAFSSDAFVSMREIRIAVPEWTGEHEALFNDLSVKEALGDLTRSQAKDLEKLDSLRRSLVNAPSGEEILQRYSRAKFDRSLLTLLSQHVRVEAFPKNQA